MHECLVVCRLGGRHHPRQCRLREALFKGRVIGRFPGLQNGPQRFNTAAEFDRPESHLAKPPDFAASKAERRTVRSTRVISEAVQVEALHVAGQCIRFNAVPLPSKPKVRLSAPVSPDRDDGFERGEAARVPQLAGGVAHSSTDPTARGDRRHHRTHRLLKDAHGALDDGSSQAACRALLSGDPRGQAHDSDHG